MGSPRRSTSQRPGRRYIVTSFGSGAGSDSFVMEVTDNIERKRSRLVPVLDLINRKKIYVDYATYLKNRGSIKREMIMREVAVVGVGLSKFGERWEAGLKELMAEAGIMALRGRQT